MGNWLENNMRKLSEQERQKQTEADIKARLLAEEKAKADAELARQQKELNVQKERIEQDLRDVLIKYRVSSMLRDVRDTVWKGGRIIEESYISPEFTSTVAIGLVYAYREQYTVDSMWVGAFDSSRVIDVSPFVVKYICIDGVVICARYYPSHGHTIHFKSGILVSDDSNSVKDYHLHQMRERFTGDYYGKDPGPKFQPISGRDDSEIISNLQIALATDSFNRQKSGRLPKRGWFSNSVPI